MSFGLIIFFFIFMIFFFAPVIIIIVMIVKMIDFRYRSNNELQNIAQENSWTYMPRSRPFHTHDNWVQKGIVTLYYSQVLTGRLPLTRSQFVQYIEDQGNKPNIVVTRVAIQDTKIEVLLLSKYGFNVVSGTPLEFTIASRKHHFEGTLNHSFDVYYSDNEQLDVYTLFGPDVMLYIDKHLRNTSIAINGSYLFVYSSDIEPASRQHIVSIIDGLVKELKLETSGNANMPVLARTAKDNAYQGVKTIKQGVTIKFLLKIALFIVGFGLLLMAMYDS